MDRGRVTSHVEHYRAGSLILTWYGKPLVARLGNAHLPIPFPEDGNKPQRGNPRCTWIASSTARSPALERTPTWLLSRVLSAAMI